MNMFARFDENPAMTIQDIKETKRYGRTHNVKTVYPPQTKFAGGIIKYQMCINKIIGAHLQCVNNHYFVLFDLTLYIPSTIFQLCSPAQGHNAVTPVRLEPAAPRARVKHSTTEPLRSLNNHYAQFEIYE